MSVDTAILMLMRMLMPWPNAVSEARGEDRTHAQSDEHDAYERFKEAVEPIGHVSAQCEHKRAKNQETHGMTRAPKRADDGGTPRMCGA